MLLRVTIREYLRANTESAHDLAPIFKAPIGRRHSGERRIVEPSAGEILKLRIKKMIYTSESLGFVFVPPTKSDNVPRRSLSPT